MGALRALEQAPLQTGVGPDARADWVRANTVGTPGLQCSAAQCRAVQEGVFHLRTHRLLLQIFFCGFESASAREPSKDIIVLTTESTVNRRVRAKVMSRQCFAFFFVLVYNQKLEFGARVVNIFNASSSWNIRIDR